MYPTEKHIYQLYKANPLSLFCVDRPAINHVVTSREYHIEAESEGCGVFVGRRVCNLVS